MKHAFYGIKSEGDLQGKGNANARISRQTRYNTNNANKEYWRKSYYWNIGKYRRRPRCIGSGTFCPSTDEHNHLPALRQTYQSGEGGITSNICIMEQELILYNSADGKSSVSLLARDGSVWLNQMQLAELFATSVPNISQHINNILKESELDSNSTIKYFLTVATNGKPYQVKFYSLEMILAVGFRVRSIRGVQFRQWANRNLAEYLRKGFVIDDERLKNPDGRPDHFDELLARIRDIRASEKRFYQKVRDLFALSSDYDKTDKATQMFYAETQNKLLYAVTGQTSAEIVTTRADADAPNMGLTSWKGAVVRKQDVIIAKNYLTHDELDSLNRLVVIFLETAEFRAKNRKDLTMNFWRENVDKILLSNDQRLLSNAGMVRKEHKDEFAYQVYEEFNARRKRKEAIEADREDMEQLKELENEIKNRPI